MRYDIIFVVGERYFDHPLCGIAILKRVLEKEGFSVGVIETPGSEKEVISLGEPKLFFAITSGSIDSMLKNYTPLKKKREEDPNEEDYYKGIKIPDRAVIVYSNWIRKNFPRSKMVLGGAEASLRRFVHYDYWDNKLRKPILFDSRADILSYGPSEKQIVEIARRIKEGKGLEGIEGTCIIANKEKIKGRFTELPSFEEVNASKEKFCEMQNKLSNDDNIIQKIDNRFIVQFKAPVYTSEDLDSYYEMHFLRDVPKELRGFQFSVVTHRGCIGECNFCSLKLMQGTKIISRSEASILREIKEITKHSNFKGNIDDLGGPSANMYGMDCINKKCMKSCMECSISDKSNLRMINLLRKVRKVPGVKNVYIRSGIRYDLATDDYLREVIEHHIYDHLRVAPEHTNKKVLKLMNKDRGDVKRFIERFERINKELRKGKRLSFYFMVGHPGSGIKEAEELRQEIEKLKNAETIQIFTPTPMTVSTCMYHTGMDPRTMEKVYVPYTYSEKKEQKRIAMGLKKRILKK